MQEEEEAAARQKAAAAAAASAAAEGARDRALEEMRLDKGALAAPGAPRGGLALEGAAAEDVQQMTQDRVRANRDQLCNLSAALAVLASSSVGGPPHLACALLPVAGVVTCDLPLGQVQCCTH